MEQKSWLSNFDAFPKVDANCLKKTTVGGVTTIIVYFVIFFLFFWEIFEYFNAPPTHSFSVDMSIYEVMKVTLDISVASNCEGFSSVNVIDILVAVIDTSGETMLIVFVPPKSKSTKTEPLPGCRIYGTFPVNKVTGKIHIVPLPSLRLNIVGLPIPIMLKSLNFSHYIHKLSFGKDYPGQSNPLESSFEYSDDEIKSFNYFVSVIPTQYKGYFGKTINSNQYAVNEYTGFPRDKMPGIFFIYDLEPLSVKIDANRSFLHTFIVRLVGIIGGVYTFSSILFNVVYFFMQGKTNEPNYQKLSL